MNKGTTLGVIVVGLGLATVEPWLFVYNLIFCCLRFSKSVSKN